MRSTGNDRRIQRERKFWDRLGPEYDVFIQKHWKIYETSLLDRIVDDVETDGIVLDVACGTGLVTLEVARKAKRAYGIDIASSMIDEAREKMSEKEIGNVEFLVEDAYELPFDDNMFDMVVCNCECQSKMHPL